MGCDRLQRFGLAVMEGMAAGCYPILPLRLSYPELLDLENSPEASMFFYDGSVESLAKSLGPLLSDPKRLHRPALRQTLRKVVQRYDWNHRAPEMDRALVSLGRIP